MGGPVTNWGWDVTNEKWRRVAVDEGGKLLISDADPFEIVQDTPEDLKHVPHGYDYTNEVYRPFAVDENGIAQTSGEVSGDLGDLDDVNVPSPADQQGIEWDTATSKWILAYLIRHALLTTRGDIIFRGASVPERLAKGTSGKFLKQGASDPAWANAYLIDLLTTRGDIVYRGASAPLRLAKGTSGKFLKQGADDPAWANAYLIDLLTTQGDIVVRGAAAPERLAKITTGQYLKATATGYEGAATAGGNLITWKDASERALQDQNRTTDVAWSDLDLTAYTSAAALFTILLVTLSTDTSGSAGTNLVQVRKNGTTPTAVPDVRINYAMPDGSVQKGVFILGLDGDEVMEYYIGVATNGQIDIYIDVLGYIE